MLRLPLAAWCWLAPASLRRRCLGAAGGRHPGRGQSRQCRETPTNRHNVLGVARQPARASERTWRRWGAWCGRECTDARPDAWPYYSLETVVWPGFFPRFFPWSGPGFPRWTWARHGVRSARGLEVAARPSGACSLSPKYPGEGQQFHPQRWHRSLWERRPAAMGRLPETSSEASTQALRASPVAAKQGRGSLRRGQKAASTV